MRDPYYVLGVSSQSSDDEIKKAYRKLSRMYHPDTNINNPNKDLAEEKFKEVQLAYEQIMEEREKGQSAGSQRSSYSNPYGQQSYSSGSTYSDPNRSNNSSYSYRSYNYRSSSFNGKLNLRPDDSPEVKGAIAFFNKGMYNDAMRVLNGVINYARDARWYYVRANVNRAMGNIVRAREDALTAVGLDEMDMEYAEFYKKMTEEDVSYRYRSHGYGRRTVCNPKCCSTITCVEICVLGECLCTFSRYFDCYEYC